MRVGVLSVVAEYFTNNEVDTDGRDLITDTTHQTSSEPQLIGTKSVPSSITALVVEETAHCEADESTIFLR